MASPSPRYATIIPSPHKKKKKFTSEAPVRKICISVDASRDRPPIAADSTHGVQSPLAPALIGAAGAQRLQSSLGSAHTSTSEMDAEARGAIGAAPPAKARSRDSTRGDLVYLIFTVTDTGQGLEESERVLLFQRFKQATPRTHVQYGGSGLVNSRFADAGERRQRLLIFEFRVSSSAAS